MFRSTTPSWSASLGVVLRQSAQQLNDHRPKPTIFLGCSDLGTLTLWHFDTLRLGAGCSNEWTAWSQDALLNRTLLRIDVNLTVQLTI
jgi:hypothetical protein